MADPPPHVFVSHASADAGRVRGLAAALERAGVRAWVDRSGIPGGANYGPEIVAAIRNCGALVVCCSAAAFASRNVRQEVALAWKHERPILPIRLEPADVPDDLAYWLEAAQWVEVLDRAEGDWLPEVLRALGRLGVAVGAPPPPVSPPAGLPGPTLPTPLTALLGRDAAVREIAGLLGSRRLVTLTGPGGVGKTRLAIEAAQAAAPAFPDGVGFADLTPVREPALVLPAVARALDVRETPGRPLVEAIAAVLGGRRRLLVLDNLEQVLAAAPDVAAVLAACPGLAVLATSRAPLAIRGERVYRVDPLPLPGAATGAAPDRLAASPAVALFAERAADVRPGFALTAANVADIAAICARLDGLPLAIELAAARARHLPPAALLARLGARLPVLTGGARDAPDRQRTMRGTIAWSHDLLSSGEQALFRRLAVFDGGFTLEAAEAVGDEDGTEGVLDRLVSLAEGSLVREVGPPGGPARYTMLETVREYGWEQLTTSGEADAVRNRHSAWSVALAEQADPLLLRPGQEPTLDELAAEHANLRAALDWLEAGDAAGPAIRLAGALRWFWLIRGDYREGIDRLERALRLPVSDPVPPAARARALTGLGFLASMREDHGRAASALAEALALARIAADAREIGWALHGAGIAAWTAGDYARAERHYAEALGVFRDLATRQPAERPRVAAVLADLGGLAAARGDAALAEERSGEALAEANALGFSWLSGLIMVHLGRLARERAEDARALTCYRDALAIGAAHGDRRIVAHALEGVAAVGLTRGQAERAARLFGAAAALYERIGAFNGPIGGPQWDRERAAVRLALGENDFGRAWEVGRSLPVEEAEAEASAVAEEITAAPSAGPDAPAGLTP